MVDLVKVLFDNRVPLKRIGVITPYKAQVKRIQKQLKDRYVCYLHFRSSCVNVAKKPYYGSMSDLVLYSS